MRILIAIDGSASSRRAVDYVARHHVVFGRALRLTCLFVEAPPALRAVGALGTDPGMPPLPPVDPQQLAAPALQALHVAGYQPDFEVREGDPALEITQAARDGGYDLVVMGSHGRGLLRRALLGSVASRVLSGCEVPALIVR